MRKLFLLEDDLSLISGLTFAFKKQGFALDTARTLAEAEGLWSDRKYDLLVLDVSLPDGSGFDFCQKVRRTSNVPIPVSYTHLDVYKRQTRLCVIKYIMFRPERMRW